MECPKCQSDNPDDSHFCRICGSRLEMAGEVRGSGTEPGYGPHRTLVPGSTFAGRYLIIQELGRGGMGIVYEAEDSKLKRRVALKFLPWELTRSPEAKERFFHEAQAASSLDHANICAVHEIDETGDGQIYISMGCYDGETLEARIERAPLSVDEASEIGIQIAAGLREAHEKDIIHRDIKPSNVMVTDRGEVKIMDFGLAKLAGQTRLTKAGATMGTVAYMSPEQARGEDVDHKTDIWSLGAVLHEMVTAEHPFKGEYDQAVIYSILHEEPGPLAETGAAIPSDFVSIVKRCLAKDKANRYESVTDVESDLRRFRLESGFEGVYAVEKTGARPGFTAGLRKIMMPVAVVIAVLILVAVLPRAREAIRRVWVSDIGPAEKVVAVLPCDLREGSREDRAFCDGLARVLTVKLAEIESSREGFRVIPADDLQEFMLGRQDATRADVSTRFGTNVVITGDLRRSDGSIRMTPVRNDIAIGPEGDAGAPPVTQHEAPEIADPIANLATWQDGVIIAIVELLGLELTGNERDNLLADGTTVPGAYESYLQGLGFMYPYTGKQDLDAAVRSLKRAVEQDSSYVEALEELGFGYVWMYFNDRDRGWLDQAIASYDQVLRLDERRAAAYVKLGYAHHFAGDHDRAIRCFDRAIALDPMGWKGHYGKGYVYEDMGEIELAEASYCAAVEADPLEWDPAYDLALIYWRTGQYEKAIAPLLRAIELRPYKTAGYTALGTVYFGLEQPGKAREMFEQSLVIDTTFHACSDLGTIYFWDQRYADAARMYEKALELEPDEYMLWDHLADAYYWSPGERQKAYDYYNKAIGLAKQELEADPADPVLLSDLASYHAMLGSESEARMYLEQVAALEPTDTDVLIHIAEACEQIGERGSALDWLERALAKGMSPIVVDRYPILRRLRADPRCKRLLDEYDHDGAS
jgi:tetratricopeptide (TPR) repeat protein/TolB-like protein